MTNAELACLALMALVAILMWRAWAALARVEGLLFHAHERLDRIDALSPHARMLGRVVEARKYEGYDWEPCMVVGVGWHGSLGLRKMSELDRRGFWVRHDRVATHVREIGEGGDGA